MVDRIGPNRIKRVPWSLAKVLSIVIVSSVSLLGWRTALTMKYLSWALLLQEDYSAADGGHPDQPTKSCKSEKGVSGFIPQRVVSEIAINFTQANPLTRQGKNPDVFGALLLEVMRAAANESNYMLTFQIGGNDGKSNDPFYDMTRGLVSLDSWFPVVTEPVPSNFENLAQIYETHKTTKSLPCPHLLNQAIKYNTSTTETDGRCSFCTFDFEVEACKDKPDWMKYQIGALSCPIERNRKQCFKVVQLPCGTIGAALDQVGVDSGDLAVLQIDVEGFETPILEGFFSETAREHYPPIIHFELRILMERRQADPLLKLLRNHGYGVRYKQGANDALALLGAEDFIVKK
jgi:hypothetical protein